MISKVWDLLTNMLKKIKFEAVILVFILVAHAFILTKLQFFPYPELFIYPYLTNHGLKPYSQILDQHFPGLMFLPINFDNLGMNDEYSARIWLVTIVIITHILLFFVSREILKSNKKALAVNLLYLIWQPFFEGWVLWLDTFLPLFLLPAFYFMLKNKLFLTGLLLGLGIVFKQTVVPLAGLIFLYILWEKRKLESLVNYSVGISIPASLMLLYMTNIDVLNDFIYWTIIFNLTVFAQHGTSIPSTLGFITRIVFVYSMSLIAFLHKDRRQTIILAVFLLGSLVSIFDRADFVHLQPSLPFVIIATTLGLFSIKSKKLLTVLIFIYLFVTIWWLNIFYKGHLSDKIFFFDDQTKVLARKIKQYTDEGDKIFIFGGVPHLYQMTQTLPAGNIFVFQFPWFIKVAEERILDGLKVDKPNIIVSDRTVEIEDQKITGYAREIDQYIQRNYEVMDEVGTTSILRKINP